MYNGRSLSVTGIPASSISLPTPQPLTPPASLATHGDLPMDATINITFGVLMAVLGLVGIYQAARLAANHAHRLFNADRANVADMEMGAGANADRAEERQQERDQQES